MLLLLVPQGASSSPSIASLVPALLPALNAVTFADVADWTTEAELNTWGDEALKRLANRTGLFVEWEAGRDVDTGQAEQALPTGHIAVIFASYNGASIRPTTAAEFEALDPDWPDTADTPERFSMDAIAQKLRLYPSPDADNGALTLIYRTTVAATLPLPVLDYLGYAILDEARRKESDAAMPEMARHFAERAKLYETLFEHYWGPAR